jgi:class 3 adenylate cyclase
MALLDAKTRARLPDSAFAYIDSNGRRRLPINDEAHVRNALSRFNQTSFEDEAARDRARTRLLRAAKKYGIVPVGFMTGQLRTQSSQAAAGRAVIELGGLGAPEELEGRLRVALRDPTLVLLHWSESAAAYLDRAGKKTDLPVDATGRAFTLLERHGRPMSALVHNASVLQDRELAATITAAVGLAIDNERMLGEIAAGASEARTLPAGFVTFLLADIENSTGLVRALGGRYPALLTDVRRLMRAAIRGSSGREVDMRADEVFAVFAEAKSALDAALDIQRKTRARSWPDDQPVRLRIGLHSGRPTLTDTGYAGLAVHTAARVCFAGHGGQIVLSRDARDALAAFPRGGVTFGELGVHQLQGLPVPMALFQVRVDDLPADFPPPRTAAVAVSREPPQDQPGPAPASRTRRRREPAAPPG